MERDGFYAPVGMIASVESDKFVVELNVKSDSFEVTDAEGDRYEPQLNAFVLIPSRHGDIVAEIARMSEKPTALMRFDKYCQSKLDPKVSGWFLELVPVGMLPDTPGGSFISGTAVSPPLHAHVFDITAAQLDKIFDVDRECSSDKSRKARIVGTSIVHNGHNIKIRPDEFFGGHVAVLGDSGRENAATLVSILRSVFEEKNDRVVHDANFLIFDVNGDYRAAFSQISNVISPSHLKFATDPKCSQDISQDILIDQKRQADTFRIPHWFMSLQEWTVLLEAGQPIQQALLRSALGIATLLSEKSDENASVRNHIMARFIGECWKNTNQSELSKSRRCLAVIDTLATDSINSDIFPRHNFDFQGEGFGRDDRIAFLKEINMHIQDRVSLPYYSGKPFDFSALEMCFEIAMLLEEAHENQQIRDYGSEILTRFKWVRDSEDYAFLRAPASDLLSDETSQARFAQTVIGLVQQNGQSPKSGQITILDMNGLPDEVIEFVSSLITRLLFERQRIIEFRDRIPVHVVLDEAHRHIAALPASDGMVVSGIFDRVATEGLKYGIHLVVASQRPSELPKTMLSKCANFIVHRIQNRDDLTHIQRSLPFIPDSSMQRMLSLPKQHALIIGDAVNLPSIFRVRDLVKAPKVEIIAEQNQWLRLIVRPVEPKPRKRGRPKSKTKILV